MEDEPSLARSRAKRQKLDKQGRFAALEKLKNLKGTKNKYTVDDMKNVYDEVDEREYAKNVLERQEDDWIIDDGTGGYVEDGRDMFDDDLNEEGLMDSGKRKGKSSKKQKIAKPTPSSAGGNIRSMFASMPTKKKCNQTKAEADDLLENIIGEVTKENKKSPAVSSKDYLKTFSSSRLPSASPAPRAKKCILSERPQKKSPQKRARTPEPISPIQTNAPLFSEDRADSDISYSELEAAPSPNKSSKNTSAAIENVDDSTALEDSFFDADDHFDDLPSEETPRPVKKTLPPVKDAPKDILPETYEKEWFNNDWNEIGEGSNVDSSVVIDKSSLPLISNEEGEQIFRFYWWDAFEDPFKQPGTLYLFGKVYLPTAKNYASCCVAVKNIPRRIFLLPRERKMDLATNTLTNEPVSFMDVYQEFNQKIANANKIMNFKSRKVVRKYAFDLPDVPAESEYLEVKYPATHNKLPLDLQGETFSRVFGINTNALELFLLERKIKGPCWLDVKVPQTMVPCSWCKIEISCNKPEDVLISTQIAPPPPLIIMAVNVLTVLNNKSMQNEVVMLSCLTHTKFMVDKPAPSPPFEQQFCIFTRPSDFQWPFDLNREMAAVKGVPIYKHESERSLLGFFLTKVFLTDPDLIVGHDLYGFTLDTLIHRIEQLKIPNWSRIGRLKRSAIPQIKGRISDKNLVSGRLVCDTMLSARELIRARSYDLDTLCKQVLKIPENCRQDYTLEEIKEMFETGKGVLKLANMTKRDAHFILRLMYELNVVPLALQITNIAGNVMSRTLLGGRSERNEYLLLHAFSEKEYIVPDKMYGKKAVAAAENESSGKAKRKPEYAGGLVLDPKKGFYDKFILLMDFNSLYPSIIQEYNICFTTVTRSENSDEEPQLPSKNVAMGILPIEIRKLVQSRRQVKNLMKAPDLTVDLKMQYNIRQTALKLTANSMYGCLGFPHSRFYAKPLAALVTSRGREILMNTRDVVQKMDYEVIYGDTDSIMINSNCIDYDQVFSIGNKIKVEINKLYKHVELEVDGVFKYMLLLKKKKYAAIVLNKKPDGELVETQEFKGLDIVRRDWSKLSAKIGEFVLNQILSDINPDERIASIRAHLEKVASDLKLGVVPVDLLAITKQLAKNPEDYPDKKALPHLQVAMRINAKGGKKLKAGDTVSYVICDDGSNLPAVQRAYHVDELKGNDKLLMDVNYYLSQQIHPVVSRLCEPIDSLDAAFIAECLGLDPTSYRKAAAQRAQGEGGEEDDDAFNILDDVQYFKNCDKFSFNCMNESCKTTIFMDSPLYDNYLVLSRCRNPACKTAPVEYLACIKNALHLAIRSYQKKLYENWMVCEDPACKTTTRRVSMQFVNSLPVCTVCKIGLRYREYRNPDLYYQLKFFSHMFNTKSIKQQMSPQIANAYKALHDQVENVLNASAYRVIDFSKIFKFTIKKNKTLPSVSQRSIADSQKKWSAI